MKTCPVCQRSYADETMTFCLADGTRLLDIHGASDLGATWRLTPRLVEPPPTEMKPTVVARQTDESKPLTTIQYDPELQMARPPSADVSTPSRPSPLPWLFAIVLVLAASGVLIAWILTRSLTTTQSAKGPPAPPPGASEQTEPTTEGSAQKSQAIAEPSAITAKSHPRPQATPQLLVRRPVTAPAVAKNKSANAKREKTTVTPPKPTGESFVPVSPRP
jgi:hypothetical protein